MKNFRVIMVITVFFAVGFAVTSCGGGSAHEAAEAAESTKTEMSDKKADTKADMTEHKAEEKAADKTGKEYTSAYVCPMHCEGSGSAEPGKCPVCGMDYVKNEDHEGHQH